MKKLFLSSSFNDVSKILTNYETAFAGKRVTFIPTASMVEKVVFYVSSGRKALEKMGLVVETLEISTASKPEIEEKLKNNDFIYVTGGNTFYLLQELKRTGTDKIIIEEVNAGKLYIGESAGAIVASANIEYAKGMDNMKKAPDLTNFDALGLVDFYPVPHYESSPFQKAAQKIIDNYSSKLNLIPISNQEAILVHNSNMRIERSI